MIIEHLLDAKALVLADRLGSFAKAARQLNIPVATFSRRIAKLESDSGVRIFNRTTRSLNTTEIGAQIVAHAQRLLDEAVQSQNLLESIQSEPSGHLKIAAPLIFGQSFLDGLISAYLKRYPKCDVFVELTNRHVDLVYEGYDVAIRLGDPGDLDSIAKPLGRLTASFYRSTKSRYADITSIESLASVDLALLRPKGFPWTDLTVSNELGESINMEVKPRFVSTNPWLLKDVSVANDYVFVMPDFMFTHSLNIEPILSGYTTTSLDVFAVYTSRSHLRPALRAFLDMLSDKLNLSTSAISL